MDRAFLAAVVESSDDVILTKTVEGVVTSINPAGERLYGYSRDELVGQHVSMLFPPDRKHEERLILDRIAAGDKVDHYETERVRKDGGRVQVELTVSPIRGEDGTVIGASSIARDVTDRRKLAELQRRLGVLEERRRQALELNDAVVQGLVIAKMALEMDRKEEAVEAMNRTLEEARGYVSSLLREGPEDEGPARFVRGDPA